MPVRTATVTANYDRIEKPLFLPEQILSNPFGVIGKHSLQQVLERRTGVDIIHNADPGSDLPIVI